MGYMVSMTCDVFIPAEKAADALAAIKAIREPVEGRSWPYIPDVSQKATLVDALAEWDFMVEVPPESRGFHVIEFVGEKLLDQDLLWDRLGPYVAEGGSIECFGEEHDRWRWYFTGTEMVLQEAKITYE